jgi:hypothetical protein
MIFVEHHLRSSELDWEGGHPSYFVVLTPEVVLRHLS